MEPSCSSCAHAFREEWSRDTDALRCGYRARSEERAPARADGVPMMKPQSAYGRVTQLFPKGKEACVEGNAPPAWCYGHYLSTQPKQGALCVLSAGDSLPALTMAG